VRTRSTCRAEVPHGDCLSETESEPTRLCQRGDRWPTSGLPRCWAPEQPTWSPR